MGPKPESIRPNGSLTRSTSSPFLTRLAAASTPLTDLQSVGCVDATRGPKAGTVEHHRRYFITSLPARVAPFAHAVRSHWQIENACHWTLDVVLNEDQNRSRRDAAPANLDTLRRWALSLMRQDATQHTGLKGSDILRDRGVDVLPFGVFAQRAARGDLFG